MHPALVEDSAQRRDMHGNIALLDDCPPPHSCGYLVLRDQVATSVNQESKDFERTGAEDDQDFGAVLAAPE